MSWASMYGRVCSTFDDSTNDFSPRSNTLGHDLGSARGEAETPDTADHSHYDADSKKITKRGGEPSCKILVSHFVFPVTQPERARAPNRFLLFAPFMKLPRRPDVSIRLASFLRHNQLYNKRRTLPSLHSVRDRQSSTQGRPKARTVA